MRKVFDFGKIAYTGKARSYAVTLEVELREDAFGRPTFSVCGIIWNASHTGIVCGGQCLDEIARYKNQLNDVGTFNLLYSMWKKYHLNDMKAGTPEQEEAIELWKSAGNNYDYKEACKYLESIGLYEVEYHAPEFNGMYKYGHAWLYKDIEPRDLDKILEVLGLEKH